MKKRKIIIALILIIFAIIFVFFRLNSKEIKSITKTHPFIKKIFVDSGEEIIGTWDISLTESDSVVANLYGDGRLVISGTGKMKSWTNEDNDDWHNKEVSILIKQVVVENGVTLIGRDAFTNCENLLSVKIGKDVERIGNDGSNLIISDKDLSEEEAEQIIDGRSIVWRVFFGCPKLTNIDVSIDNNKYSSIDGILFNKNQTEIEYYPTGKNESTYILPNTVTKIRDYAFKNAKNLSKIEISETVEKIGTKSFDDCTNLNEFYVNENSTTFCSIDGILLSKDQTEIIRYPQGKKSTTYTISEKIKKINSYAFKDCKNLNHIEFSKNNINDITIQIGTFYNCTGLTFFKIPKNVTIDENLFFPLIITNPFLKCSNLKEIAVEEENPIYSCEDGVLFSKDKTKLIYYPEGKSDSEYAIPESVTNISSDLFVNCTNLNKIVIPDNINNLSQPLLIIEGMEWNNNINLETAIMNNYLDVTIICKKDSAAEQYAIDKEIDYEIDESAPEISFNESLENVTKNDIELTIKDSLAGLRSVIINEQKLTIENNQAKYTVSENGKYTLTAIDNLGNTLTQEINITNIDKNVPTATITTDKEKYYEGETAKITATFNEEIKDGTPKISISGVAKLDKTDMVKSDSKKYTYSYVVPKGTGKQTITISDASDLAGNIMEENKAKEFNIEQILLENIKVTKEPNKKTYKERENFDKTGMKVTATYNNKTSKEITNYTITDGDNLTLNKTSVTISYTENEITKTTTQAITVIENEELSFNDYVEVNKDNKKYLTNIKNNTTIEQFKNNIKTNAAVKIYKNNKEITSNNEKISTGMKIRIELNNETLEYSLVIKGDVNGDGVAEIKDLLTLNKHRLNKTLLENEYFLAGDIDNDNVINIRDLLQLNKFRLRKINVL